MMLGDLVGPNGGVVVVEATLHNADVAWRNVALNDLTHAGAGLERFGTTDDLLALIPSGYEILGARSDRGPFLPLAVAPDALRHRSRLVALWPSA